MKVSNFQIQEEKADALLCMYIAPSCSGSTDTKKNSLEIIRYLP